MYKMPKTKINFNKSVIYRITCIDTSITDDYIGSTTNFIQRKTQHKKCCQDYNTDIKIYSIIRINGGWENWDMKVIEEYPCDTKHQLCIREQYWINMFHPRMNSMNAYIEKKIDAESQRLILHEIQIELLEKRKELLLLEEKYKQEQLKAINLLQLD